MSELRDKAIARKARELHREARQLERISRHRPRVSRLIGEAAKELLDESGVDCTLTSRSVEDLRRLAQSGDDEALAELIRRRELVPA